jgi:hypothetical protein
LEKTSKECKKIQQNDRVKAPENAKGVPAMAAGLFPEAGGVAHILQRQLPLLKPLVPVHRAQRLLRGCYQVLVLPLACSSKKLLFLSKRCSFSSCSMEGMNYDKASTLWLY